jgi:hypothetical protein
LEGLIVRTQSGLGIAVNLKSVHLTTLPEITPQPELRNSLLSKSPNRPISQIPPLISASRPSSSNPPPRLPDRRTQSPRKSLQLSDFRSESFRSKGQ